MATFNAERLNESLSFSIFTLNTQFIFIVFLLSPHVRKQRRFNLKANGGTRAHGNKRNQKNKTKGKA